MEDLERAGLVEVVTDGRRQTVGLAHPLHGEVVREHLPVTTRLRLLPERATVSRATARDAGRTCC